MFNDLFNALATQNHGVVLALLVVFLTLDASAGIGLFIPGDSLLLLAGTTVDGAGEALALIAGGVLACFAGASGGHWLGRSYGPRLRHSRLGRRIGERRWVQAEVLFERRGWALAVAYFLPVAHALTPAVAGAVGMPYRRFMAWAMLGSTAWVAMYVVLGAVAGQVVRRHSELLAPVAAAAVVVVLGITAVARRVVSGPRAPRGRSSWRRPR